MISKFNTLDRNEAFSQMNDWIASEGKVLPSLTDDYLLVRNELETLFKISKSDPKFKKIDSYAFDVIYGIMVYKYLNKQRWFNMRVAADDGFWRYLTIMVAPHLTASRWGYDNQDHYWKKGTRIWYRTLWWYIYLGWDNDAQSTQNRLLKDGVFSTDTILHLIERTSRRGTDIELYKLLFKAYGSLSSNEIQTLKKKVNTRSGGLFGTMMCLNTAKTEVMEPGFCTEGKKGYVKSLFFELAGINLHL